MTLLVFESLCETLETFPKLPHGLIGDSVACHTVDEVVLDIPKVSEKGIRMPDGLIHKLGHSRNYDRLPSFPRVLLLYND